MMDMPTFTLLLRDEVKIKLEPVPSNEFNEQTELQTLVSLVVMEPSR